MPKALLLDPAALRARLARRFEKRRHEWLDGVGDWPLILTLGRPTERLASAHLERVRGWQQGWAEWRGAGTLGWNERRWPMLGVQRLPESIRFDSPEEVAAHLDEQPGWARACRRVREVSARWPRLASLVTRRYEVLAGWPDEEFGQLLDVLQWLWAHPAAGIYMRQLPVPGVDSKWLEARQALVCEWLSALRGDTATTDLHALTGLRRLPTTLRMRVLDPRLRALTGGLSDIQAPVEELAALRLPVTRALLVENLQTGLALGDLPDAVVMMRQGYAVELYGQLPWLREVECHYWGDIDTHGFAILDRLRAYLPDARSVLMDERTLLAHRALWGEEPMPARTQSLPRLRPEERDLFEQLLQHRWGPCVRLEQERIPWPYVVDALDLALKLGPGALAADANA